MQHVSVNEGGRAIVGNVKQDVPGSALQKPFFEPPARCGLSHIPNDAEGEAYEEASRYD